MANEATIISSLLLNGPGNLQYRSAPNSFRADVAVANGPTPGVLHATTAGVNVDLALLASPGLCFIHNLDSSNYVLYGIKDASTGVFYPLGELLPGEGFVFRLARDIGRELTGTGSVLGSSLHIRGVGGTCNVVVEAFDR